MRIYLFVVVCISSVFLHCGKVCSDATIYLFASDSTDGVLSWNGWVPLSPIWIIEAPPGQKVLLSFDELQIDNSRYSCDIYLEVRDGQDSWSSLLTKQCDTSTLPSPVYSSGRWLFVTFNDLYGWSSFSRISAKYRALPAPSDSTQRALAIALPLGVGVILMFVIIAVVVCEKGKRQNIPRPLGPAPPAVELQTFPPQVPVPTQHPQQPVTHVANTPPQYVDEPRAELAGQTGRDLPPPYDADLMAYQAPAESHDPAAQQPNLAQGENFYAPSLV